MSLRRYNLNPYILYTSYPKLVQNHSVQVTEYILYVIYKHRLLYKVHVTL